MLQPYLHTIREGVLAHLPQESHRLLSCRRTSQCHSPVCPNCLQIAGFQKKDQLIQSTGPTPASRLKFATLTSRYVPLDQLREAAQTLVRVGRQTLRKLKIAHYALAFENSYQNGQTGHHPHIHVLADTPNGGRNHVSADTWTNEWLGQLPADLHPVDKSAYVTPVRDLEASCAYLTKSAFGAVGHVPSRTSIEQIVNGIIATKGVQKFNLRGSLAA
jgi:hypothetical protein